MRAAYLMFLFIGLAAPAGAQDAAAPCHTVSPTNSVVVTTHAGQTIRGTLLCLSENEVLLTSNGQFARTPLDSVRRITTPADPVWDGAVKGAVIPLVIWGIWCRSCETDIMLRQTLTYALIGVSFDALETNRKTLYRGDGRSTTVAWRVRF